MNHGVPQAEKSRAQDSRDGSPGVVQLMKIHKELQVSHRFGAENHY